MSFNNFVRIFEQRPPQLFDYSTFYSLNLETACTFDIDTRPRATSRECGRQISPITVYCRTTLHNPTAYFGRPILPIGSDHCISIATARAAKDHKVTPLTLAPAITLGGRWFQDLHVELRRWCVSVYLGRVVLLHG